MADYYYCFECDERVDWVDISRDNDNFEPIHVLCDTVCRPMSFSPYDDPGYNDYDEDELFS